MSDMQVLPRKSIRAVPYNAGPHPKHPNNWTYWQVEIELDDEVNRGSHITDFTIYHDVEFREKFIDVDQYEREQRDKVIQELNSLLKNAAMSSKTKNIIGDYLESHLSKP